MSFWTQLFLVVFGGLCFFALPTLVSEHATEDEKASVIEAILFFTALLWGLPRLAEWWKYERNQDKDQ